MRRAFEGGAARERRGRHETCCGEPLAHRIGTSRPSSGDEYAQRLKDEIALTEKMMKVAKIEAQ